MAALGRTESIAQEGLVSTVIDELEAVKPLDGNGDGQKEKLDALNKAATKLSALSLPKSVKDIVNAVLKRNKGIAINRDVIDTDVANLLKALKKKQDGGRRRGKTAKKGRKTRGRKTRRGGNLFGNNSAVAPRPTGPPRPGSVEFQRRADEVEMPKKNVGIGAVNPMSERDYKKALEVAEADDPGLVPYVENAYKNVNEGRGVTGKKTPRALWEKVSGGRSKKTTRRRR